VIVVVVIVFAHIREDTQDYAYVEGRGLC
jgi:hypothetical protein